MEELTRQVRRAQRLLGLDRFARLLGWCCFASLLLVPLAVWFDRRVATVPLEDWAVALIALGLGMAAAATIAYWRGRGPIDAAIEIDRRFGLKERVSTALGLSPGECDTEIGQAVVADAARRVERIDVREHFNVRPGRTILLPLASGLAALLAILFVPPLPETAEGNPDIVGAKKQIDEAQKSLQVKLAQEREKARKQGLKEADKLIVKLQEQLGQQQLLEEADKKQAIAKLNDLARQLEKRSQEFGGAEQLQKMLEQLRGADGGPADKMLDALKKGDMNRAAKELEKLKNDLAGGKLTEQQKKELAEQLKKMQEELKKAAEAQRKAADDLQKKIDQLRKDGKQDQANQLQQQLAKMQAQKQQMDMMEKMAQKLGECQQCMQQGQNQAAADKLAEMQKELQGVQQQLQEFDAMKQAMDRLDQARAQMNCEQCGGKGCKACQGEGGDGDSEQQDGEPGDGMGAGRGIGARPERDNPTSFYNSKASVKTQKGAADVTGETDGPNRKGDFTNVPVAPVLKLEPTPADPLAGRRMPKKHQQNVREYMENFVPKK